MQSELEAAGNSNDNNDKTIDASIAYVAVVIAAAAAGQTEFD